MPHNTASTSFTYLNRIEELIEMLVEITINNSKHPRHGIITPRQHTLDGLSRLLDYPSARF